ncbi:MAG: hypothetical protein IPJ65_37515 [Archangiaceae bacterium]|nr:hypothetical protein [Archangiaceae bacterium]
MGLTVALAFVAVTALNAHWADQPLDWPDAQVGSLHLYEGAAFGPCRRNDDQVPAASVCGEAWGAAQLHVQRRVRLELELGMGFQPATTSGALELGELRRSGGPLYLSVRLLVGLDFTRRFFVRLGPQLDLAWVRELRPLRPGLKVPLDLGSRLTPGLELGFRFAPGFDGVATSGQPQYGIATALGVFLFTRVLLQ